MGVEHDNLLVESHINFNMHERGVKIYLRVIDSCRLFDLSLFRKLIRYFIGFGDNNLCLDWHITFACIHVVKYNITRITNVLRKQAQEMFSNRACVP